MKLYSLGRNRPPYEIKNNKKRRFKHKVDRFSEDMTACGIFEETFTTAGTKFIFYTEPVRVELFL